MIASSKRSPPMRAELAYTTPFSDSTATSEVPPPMSSTIEPRASCTGSPAPTAAAIGSLTIATLRAPEHGLGLGADRDDHLAAARGLVLHRNHRRLVEDDPFVANVDQGISRTQIDRQIAGEITAQAFEHEATGKRRRTPKVARNLA